MQEIQNQEMRKKQKQKKRRLIKKQSCATFYLHNCKIYQGIFTRKLVFPFIRNNLKPVKYYQIPLGV